MKVGWKTSEFWLTILANLLGFLTASGVFVGNNPVARVIGIVMAVLSTMGYSYGRALIKSYPQG